MGFFKITRNQKLRDMLKAHGMANARHVVRESARVGVPLATGCAIMQAESMGHNIFGCDHGSTGNTPWCHQDVTRERVLALEHISWPHGTTNGVGPGQLTSTSFVRRADALGGSWIPKYNIRVSFQVVKDLTSRLGLQNGLNAYNGDPTGAYGRRAMQFRTEWQNRINDALR